MSEPKRGHFELSEDFDRRMAELLDLANEEGSRLPKGQEDDELAGVQELLVRRLRHAGSAGRLIANRNVGDAGIDPDERQREIIRKALSDLRSPELQRIAQEIDVPLERNKEALVESILWVVGTDEAAVARLIAKNEEPRLTRAMTHRLFPLLHTTGGTAGAHKTLDALANRYLRIGLAKWFVFHNVDQHAKRTLIDGEQRSYRVDVVDEDNEVHLGAVPQSARARIVVDDSDMVSIRSDGVTEARAAVEALEATGVLRAQAGLVIDAAHPAAPAWDPRSLLMVELLQEHLNSAPAEIWNLTTARFENERSKVASSNRSAVRAVTLEGQHLLSSSTACEMLVEGRALVSLSLFVRYSPTTSGMEATVLPVKVELGRDHVTVTTGYGSAGEVAAGQLHEWLVERVRNVVSDGPKLGPWFPRLAQAIEQRARDLPGVDEPADIFAPGDGSTEAL